jgi:hypothetical protein
MARRVDDVLRARRIARATVRLLLATQTASGLPRARRAGYARQAAQAAAQATVPDGPRASHAGAREWTRMHRRAGLRHGRIWRERRAGDWRNEVGKGGGCTGARSSRRRGH